MLLHFNIPLTYPKHTRRA